MKPLIEFIYKLAKGYMLQKATDTGNPQFVAQLNTAFVSVEAAWKNITAIGK